MHFQTSLPLISLLPVLTALSQATPIKRAFCIGSPNPIYKITNFSFQKHISSSPDVCPSASVTFNFADIYHGFSTKCHADIVNYAGPKSVNESELNPGGTFDGSKLYSCDDGDGTQFQFWEDGKVEMMHRWTCDTPGGASTQHFASSSSGQVPWECTNVHLGHGDIDFSCMQGTSDWYPEPQMIKLS